MRQAGLFRLIQKMGDTTRFRALFAQALSWFLASYLVIPVAYSAKLESAAYNNYLVEMSKTQGKDSGTEKE